MNFSQKSIAMLMLSLVATFSYAQETKNINLEQIVVTGTGTHHRQKDVAVPTTVMTQSDLQELGITTLEEALTKLNPSFSFHTNGQGTFMQLNGLPDEYILILINGKRMPNDGTGTRDLTMIDLTNVKRIEVINGAASALYGTDAIAGVINIITDDLIRISDDSKMGINVTNHFNMRSKGRMTETFNVDVTSRHLSSYTSIQRQQANAWQLSPLRENSKTHELEPTDYVASVKYHSNTVSERLEYAFNRRASVYAQGSWFDTENDRPQTIYSYNMRHENYNWGAGAKYLVNHNAYLTFDFTSDHYTSQYVYFKDVKRSGIVAGDIIDHRRQLFNVATLKGIVNIGEHNKLSVGTEYIHERLENNNFEGKRTRYNWAAFAQDEFNYGCFSAIAGVRYTYNEFFDSNLTPNLALMFKPTSTIRLRANYAMGYRAPLLNEMYSSNVATTTDRITLPNADLKPEKSNYFAFNAEYATSRLTLSAGVFCNNLRNLITYQAFDLTPEQSMAQYGHAAAQQFMNTNRARVTGINVSADLRLPLGFAVNAGYTYSDGRDTDTKERIDKSVYNTVRAGLSYSHNWKAYTLDASINGRYQDGRYSKTYQQTAPAPSFQLWDLMTTHRIALRHFDLVPGIGVENIFNWRDDRPWNSNYATLNPGRSLVASLIVKFKD